MSERLYKPSDRTLYCVLNTDKILRNASVRFVWTAVQARGLRANQKFLDRTNKLKAANILFGSAMIPRYWPTGRYKVDVYINGAKARTLNYSIR